MERLLTAEEVAEVLNLRFNPWALVEEPAGTWPVTSNGHRVILRTEQK
jgi:hypothetical protein